MAQRDAILSSSGQPAVSVITVSYNCSSTIERTILSVLSQTYPNKEYIIIDGGSTDGTVDIIRSYADRLSCWISEPDKGIYDAMNKGIERARGKWIHLINADDHYVSENSLASAKSHLNDAKTNYFSMILDYGGERQKYYRFPFKHWKLYTSAFLPHPAMIVSRDQYALVGTYDTRYRIAADHDFILRMLRHYPANYTDLPLVVMGQSGMAAQNSLQTLSEFREVTVRHGLPPLVADGLFALKRRRYKL